MQESAGWEGQANTRTSRKRRMEKNRRHNTHRDPDKRKSLRREKVQKVKYSHRDEDGHYAKLQRKVGARV